MHLPALRSWLFAAVCLAPLSPLGAAPSAPEMATHSACWPAFAELNAPLTVEVDGQAVTLLPEMRAVVIRVTDEGVWLDFGSRGQHLVPVEQTDVPASYEAIRSGALDKPMANLSAQISDKFWRWNGTRLERLGTAYFVGTERLVFLYADPREADSVELVRAFSRAYEAIRAANPGTEVVIIPGNALVQPFFDQDAPLFPVMTWHMAPGYIHALRHGVDDFPMVAITDYENRLIARVPAAEIPQEDLAGWIHGILERDRAALEAPKP